MLFYFHIQNNHQKYAILLKYTAELPVLYILTNAGIKAGKKAIETGKKKKKKKKKKKSRRTYMYNDSTNKLLLSEQIVRPSHLFMKC